MSPDRTLVGDKHLNDRHSATLGKYRNPFSAGALARIQIPLGQLTMLPQKSLPISHPSTPSALRTPFPTRPSPFPPAVPCGSAPGVCKELTCQFLIVIIVRCNPLFLCYLMSVCLLDCLPGRQNNNNNNNNSNSNTKICRAHNFSARLNPRRRQS